MTQLKNITLSNKQINNSVLYVTQVIITCLLPLISIPIIAHKLTPDDFGVFALAQVYASIAVGIMNWGAIVGYERSYFLYEKSLEESGALLSTVTVFVVINLIMLLSIAYYFRQSISKLIFENIIYGDLIVIILSALCLSAISNYYLTYLKNSGAATEYIISMLLQSFVNFALILIYIYYFDAGVYSLAYALLLSNLLLYSFLSIKQLRMFSISFNKEMLWDVLKISLPLTPRVFFGFLSTQFDKIMLGLIGTVDIGGVGVYSIGQRVSQGIFLLMTALGRVFTPEVFRKLFSATDPKNNEIGSYLVPFAYISIFIALIVSAFSQEIFSHFFPRSYSGSVEIVIILAVYYASMFFGKITGTQLIYAKKTHITTALSLIGIAFNVLLNIPMIIKWGINGAAWATTIAGIAMNILAFRLAQRYSPINWEWKPIVIMYSLFLCTVIFSLTSIMNLLQISYLSILIIKLSLIIVYIYFGRTLDIITIINIKNIYNFIFGFIRRKAMVN